MAEPLHIREAQPEELGAIVALAGRALGWDPNEPNRALFEWKHHHNPFGPSGLWVAEQDGALVGLRALMRWEFVRPDGTVVRAVRPVDTATDPDHQGRGIFRQLTERAIAVETDAGVSFVFNTPNAQSRPGYLKMGWQEAGRVPTHVRPLSPIAAWHMLRARQPAQKWSVPTDLGDDPVERFTDDFTGHLTGRSTDRGDTMTTHRSGPFLRWRYGLPELHYRAIATDDAAVIFRRRRRGPAIEGVIADVLATDDKAGADVVGRLRRQAPADYLLAAGRRQPGLVRLPRQGPILTTRPLADRAPLLRELRLDLGDIELF